MKKKLLAAVLVIAMVLTFIVPVTVSADWEQQPDESWKYYSEQDESYYIDGVYWIDDNAYYFDENGIRQSGWVQNDQGEWFFSYEDGVLLTGWQTANNKIWFYFDPNDCHRYESGTYVIDGEEYTFSDTGVCENKLENETGTSTYPSMQGGSGAYPSMQGGSGAYPSMQGGSGAYPSMQGGSGAYPSMQGGSGAYPSMQGGSGAYPSMQGGTGAYGSMQGSVAVYPSMQNGVDISGAIYSVTPVYKTIKDETAASVSQIPSKDLHFIQEWKVESNVYPLNVTFYVAGAQNNTIYVFSDDENGWTKMNKGAGSSLTVTFTHDTRAAVYVGPSLLTSFQINDVEILENTGGYMSSGYDPVSGTYLPYYFYNLEMQVNIYASFVYDGRTYSGTWNELGGIISRLTGVYPEQWLSYNQSYENQWTVGNSYQVTGCLMGQRDTFEVTINECKLDSIEIEDIEIIENTCGNWTYDYSTGQPSSFYYYFPSNSNNLQVTVVYDGITYSGSLNNIQNTLESLTGTWPSFQINNDDQYANHWTVGNHYTVTGELLGKTDTFDVIIKESPLDSIEIADFEIIENTLGYWTNDYNDGQQSPRYFCYQPGYSNDYQITVVYDGTTYSGSWRDVSDTLYQLTGEWNNMEFTTDPYQSYENRWTVGNTYTVTARFLGKTDVVNVTIVPSPISDFHIDDMEIIAGTCGYWSSSSYNGSYFIFSPEQSRSFKATYTLNGETYTAYNAYDLPEITNERIEIDNNAQYGSPWVVGRTYPVTARLLGAECTFNVTIVENLLTSFEVEDLHILEHTNGYETSDRGPDSDLGKYFRYSTVESPLTIKIVYDNETVIGNETEISQFLTEKLGTNIYVNSSWDNQSSRNPWTAGHTYEGRSQLLDRECQYSVTIDSAVDPISLVAEKETDVVLYLGHNYMSSNIVRIRYAPENADLATEWTTGDNNIVSISNNNGRGYLRPYITPVSVGQTVITAKSKSNPNLSVTFNVTVVDEEAPVGTYTTTATFGPKLPDTSYPTLDPEKAVVNPDVYFLRSNSDCVMELQFTSDVCLPLPLAPNQSWFDKLTICDVTPTGGMGGLRDDGTMFSRTSYLITAKEAGTEILKIGNNYEVVLEVGDYAITFVDENGEVLQQRYVAEGEKPVYTGETPVKEADDQYTYTFAGWTPEIVAATEDTTYTATYEATVNQYTVTFADEDGAVLSAADYPYGTAAGDIVKPKDPVKAADAQYTYVFDKWTPEITDVTGDVTYTATYRNIPEVEDVTVHTNEEYSFDYEYDMNRSVSLEVRDGALLNYTYSDQVYGFTTNLISFKSVIIGAGEDWIFITDTDTNEILKAYHLEILPQRQEVTVCKGQYVWDITEPSGASSLTADDSDGVNIIWRKAEQDVASWVTDYAEGPYVYEHTFAVFGKEAGDYEVTFYYGDLVNRVVTYHVIEGHQYKQTSSTVTTEPTCTEAGEKAIEFTCDVCGDTYTELEVIPATGHTYGEWIVTKAATCTEVGSREKYCSECNDKVTETIAALGHTWEEEYTVDKAATCTEEGSKSIHCAVCDAVKEDSSQIIEKLPHTYGEWIVTKAATCTETGSREKYCSECNDKVTETIAALGHTWEEEYTVDKAATCTEEGSKSIHCAVCDAVKEDSSQVIEKLPHTYGEWIVTKAATCTEAGSREKICTDCNDKVTETIPAIGHDISKIAAKDATFTEDGNTEYWYCSNCKKYFSDEEGQNEIKENSWIIPKKQDSYNHYTGIVNDEGTLTYLTNGLPDTSVSGIYKYTDIWCYVKNGYVDTSYEGVEKNQNGWWCIHDGKVDFSYTGFERNANGWWYIEKGQVKFDKNDIINGKANTDPQAAGEDGWWLVRGGQVVEETTVANNANGWWFVRDGKVDFDYTGVQRNDNGWWAIIGGKVDFNYTGFSKNDNGWWYCEKGQVKFDKNDIISGKANTDPKAEGEDGWWLVRGSQVVKDTIVANNANGWWYVKDGKVDFTHNGVEQNANGWWYIHNGKVDFGYTGFERNSHGWWYCENGQVTFKKNDVINGKANSDPNAGAEAGWWNVKGSQVVKGPSVEQNANGWWYIDGSGKVDFNYNNVGKNAYGEWYIKNGQVDFKFTGDAYGHQFKDGKLVG